MAQDDEPTLLLAVGCEQEEGIHPQIEQPPPPQESKPATPRANPPPIHADGQLHFIENKAFAAFDESGDRDPKRWVLDTGASNHMSGARVAFSSIDTGVAGSVRFGDGSVARIEGIGTVLFSCKNGEHRAINNVYYLPRLTTNIISVGQLDESGYQVLVESGVMRV